MRTFGDIVMVESSGYLSTSGTLGYKIFDNGVIWNLSFVMTIETQQKLREPTPNYFIFLPLCPDTDGIRFDIKEPKYLTGYNETRKFHKDELEWVIEVLHDTVDWNASEDLEKEQGMTNFDMHTVWGHILYEYNRYRESQDEIWNIPDYSLLETED